MKSARVRSSAGWKIASPLVPAPAIALVDRFDTAGNNAIATPVSIVAGAVVNVLD